MRQTKKILAVVLALVLSLSLLPATGVSAASKKVKLNKTKATIYVGKTVKLKVKNTKKKVKWSTSNKKVATVTKKGKVKGKKAGKATITAKVGKKKYKCKIKVKAKKKPQITKKTTQKKPPTDDSANWEFRENETGITITGYKGTDTDVVIPSKIQGKSVTSIGEDAFNGCSSLRSITIPNSVTSIGDFAFKGCSSLTNVKIPDKITSISDSAFNGCSSLTSITIPDSVTSIDRYAFYGCCYILKENFVNNSALDAEENNYWGAAVYDEIINGLYIRYDRNFGKVVVGMVDKEATEAVIPEGITRIQSNALFYDYHNLVSITIPESVTGFIFNLLPRPMPERVLTIKGKAGSYAEKLAQEYGFNFIAE